MKGDLNIKKYTCEDSVIFVGEADEIKALYKSLRRNGGYYCSFYADYPTLNPNKLYGLDLNYYVSDTGHYSYFAVINSDTLARLFNDGLMKAA